MRARVFAAAAGFMASVYNAPGARSRRLLRSQPRLPEAFDEARLPRVLDAELTDAHRDLGCPSLSETEISQVAEELHRLIVLSGLLGGDERADLVPCLHL